MDLVLFGSESGCLAPIVESRTIITCDFTIALVRMPFMAVMRPMNVALGYAIKQRYAQLDDAIADINHGLRGRARATVEQATDEGFPEAFTDALEYMMFSMSHAMSQLLKHAARHGRPPPQPLELAKVSLQANEVELLGGALLFAAEHPERVKSLRVLEYLGTRGVYAVDAYIGKLSLLGVEL